MFRNQMNLSGINPILGLVLLLVIFNVLGKTHTSSNPAIQVTDPLSAAKLEFAFEVSPNTKSAHFFHVHRVNPGSKMLITYNEYIEPIKVENSIPTAQTPITSQDSFSYSIVLKPNYIYIVHDPTIPEQICVISTLFKSNITVQSQIS